MRHESIFPLWQLQPLRMGQRTRDVRKARLPVLAHGHATKLVILEMPESRSIAIDQVDQAVAAVAGQCGGTLAPGIGLAHAVRNFFQQFAQQAPVLLSEALHVGNGAGPA